MNVKDGEYFSVAGLQQVIELWTSVRAEKKVAFKGKYVTEADQRSFCTAVKL
jgi:hypothetical protein